MSVRSATAHKTAPHKSAQKVQRELEDGSVVVEFAFAGIDWLVREVLKEAGDAVVLEPADARAAVRAAAETLAAAAHS